MLAIEVNQLLSVRKYAILVRLKMILYISKLRVFCSLLYSDRPCLPLETIVLGS